MPLSLANPSVPSEPARAVLSARQDIDRLRAEFSRLGRVVVPDALVAEIATRWLQRLSSWSEWALVTRVEGQHRSFDAAGMAVLPAEKRADFDELVARGARSGFQYLFERYPLYDLGRVGRLFDPVLAQIYALLRSPELVALARAITGDGRIAFADGQVTRYRRGHFLTLHDDRAEGMQRVSAYVLNLTPQWSADYGGQLQFLDAAGQVEDCVGPRFNALTLFAVPQPHLVSAVAPFVSDSRYALTGWFHHGEEPAVPG
jgi:SM-20-related protein